MDKNLFDELVQAISEDFSLEELSDIPTMQTTLATLLATTPNEAEHIIIAAAAVKRVRGEIKPFWRYLLNIH